MPKIPPESGSAPQYSAFKCRNARGAIQANRRYPDKKRIPVTPCRTRGCEDCGPIWNKRNQWRLRRGIESIGGQWSHIQLSKKEWRNLRRRLQAEYPKMESFWAKLTAGMYDILVNVTLDGATVLSSDEAIHMGCGWVDNCLHVDKPLWFSKGFPELPKPPKKAPEESEWVTVGPSIRQSIAEVLSTLMAHGVEWDIHDIADCTVVEWTEQPAEVPTRMEMELVCGGVAAAHVPLTAFDFSKWLKSNPRAGPPT